MIDTLALALTHGLLALTAWRLLARPDLDANDPKARPASWRPRGGQGERPDA